MVDPCSGRTIVFRVNRAGGRGADWSPARAPGIARILVVGESSTFGVNSPDGATWPAALEAELRTGGEGDVEVLNGGQPGQQLAGMLTVLPGGFPATRPTSSSTTGATTTPTASASG